MKEIWKDIGGYESLYQVSTLGNVRSLDRITSIGRNVKGKILKKNIQVTGGFTTVSVILCNAVSQNRKQVCRLVYETFTHKANGMHIRHMDGNRLNNRLDNLISISITETGMLKKPSKSSTSKYKGVCRNNRGSGSWMAAISIKGRFKNLGNFEIEIEAAKAYDKYVYENCHGFYETNDSLGLYPMIEYS